MEFYKFTTESGHHITEFNSNFYMKQVMMIDEEAKIGLIQLNENGVIGYHQAVTPQLLLIIQGEGLVRSYSEKFYSLQPGEAVFWTQDEWHETKTEKGLIGLIIESKIITSEQIILEKIRK